MDCNQIKFVQRDFRVSTSSSTQKKYLNQKFMKSENKMELKKF